MNERNENFFSILSQALGIWNQLVFCLSFFLGFVLEYQLENQTHTLFWRLCLSNSTYNLAQHHNNTQKRQIRIITISGITAHP